MNRKLFFLICMVYASSAIASDTGLAKRSPSNHSSLLSQGSNGLPKKARSELTTLQKIDSDCEYCCSTCSMFCSECVRPCICCICKECVVPCCEQTIGICLDYPYHIGAAFWAYIGLRGLLYLAQNQGTCPAVAPTFPGNPN